MSIIKIYEKAGKTKRKPGWQKAEAEHQKWLDSMKSMTSGMKSPKPGFTAKTLRTFKPSGVYRTLTDTSAGISQPPKAQFVRDTGTKKVLRPEITYADNPEMLDRELKARERKFNVAPAYNKGNDVFVTEESLQALLSSNKRRS